MFSEEALTTLSSQLEHLRIKINSCLSMTISQKKLPKVQIKTETRG